MPLIPNHHCRIRRGAQYMIIPSGILISQTVCQHKSSRLWLHLFLDRELRIKHWKKKRRDGRRDDFCNFMLDSRFSLRSFPTPGTCMITALGQSMNFEYRNLLFNCDARMLDRFIPPDRYNLLILAVVQKGPGITVSRRCN